MLALGWLPGAILNSFMSADEPLFIITEELLLDLYESQLGVLILIISGECSVCLWITDALETGLSITSPFRSSHLLPVKLRGRTVLVENVTSVPPRNKVGAFQMLGLYKP